MMEENFKSWPGLEQWGSLYHFFRKINVSKPINKYFYNLYTTLLVLHLICVNSKLFFLSQIETDIVSKTFVSIIGHYIYWSSIPTNFLSISLFICAFFISVFLITIAKIPHLLFEPGVSLIARFILQMLTFYFLLVSSSVLQIAIITFINNTEATLYFLIFAIISFVFYFVLSLISTFFLSKAMSLNIISNSFWDQFNLSLYIYFTCAVQQISIVIHSFPDFGPYILFSLNFIMNAFFFWKFFELSFYSIYLNIILLATSSFSMINSIILLLAFNFPSQVKVFNIIIAFVFLLDFVYLSSKMYDRFSIYIGNLLQKSKKKEVDKFEDLSDNSDIEINLPRLPPRQLIILIRYLLIRNHQDLNELTIRIAENQDNSSVILECFRILHLQNSVPSSVWSKILDIDKEDVNFYDRPLLCNLQYEAMKHEIKESIVELLIEKLDKYKLTVQRSLIRFINALQNKDTEAIALIHKEYTFACKQYEILIRYYLENAPSSPEIISHYIEYLLKLKGDYINANIWQQKAKFLKSDHIGQIPVAISSSSSVISSTNSLQNQEIIEQEASVHIKVKTLPLVSSFIAIFFLSLMLCLYLNPTTIRNITEILHNPIVNIYEPMNFVLGQSQLVLYSSPQFVDMISLITKYLKFRNVDVSSFEEFIVLPDSDRKSIYSSGLSYVSYIVSSSLRHPHETKNYQEIWSSNIISQDFPYSLEFSTTLFRNYVERANNYSDTLTSNEEFVDTIRKVFHLATEINKSTVNFVNTTMEYLELITENQENQEIIWVIITVFINVLLFISIYFLNYHFATQEFQKIFTVFSFVDAESLAEFRSSILSLINKTQGTTSIDRILQEEDNNSLALDEIELSENNPISLPISLSFQQNNDFLNNVDDGYMDTDEADKISLNFQNKMMALSIIFFIIYLLCSILTCIGHIFVSQYGTNISKNLSEALVIVPFSYYSLIEALLYFANISSQRPPLVCNIIDPMIKEANYLNQLCLNYSKRWEEWAGIINDDFVDLVNSTFNNNRFISINMINMINGNFKQYRTYNTALAHGSSSICLFLIFFIVLFLALHLSITKRKFDSLISISRLIPSRYFSTTAALLEIFEYHENNETENPHYLQHVLMHSIDPVFIIDQNTKILDAGQSALSLFAYKLNEIIGKSISTIIPEFKSKTKRNPNEIITFDAKAVRRKGSKIQMSCMLIKSKSKISVIKNNIKSFEPKYSLVLMRNMSTILEIERQTNEANKKLQAFLLRLMPPKFVDMYLSNTPVLTFSVPITSIAVLAVTNFCEFCSCHTHEEIFDFLSFFQGNVDRILSKFSCISKLGTDNGQFYFMIGLINDVKLQKQIKCLIDFLQAAVGTLLEKRKNLGSYNWCKIVAAVHTGKNMIGGIALRESPSFNEWSMVFSDLKRMSVNIPSNKIRLSKQTMKYYKKTLPPRATYIKESKDTVPQIKTYLIPISN